MNLVKFSSLLARTRPGWSSMYLISPSTVSDNFTASPLEGFLAALLRRLDFFFCLAVWFNFFSSASSVVLFFSARAFASPSRWAFLIGAALAHAASNFSSASHSFFSTSALDNFRASGSLHWFISLFKYLGLTCPVNLLSTFFHSSTGCFISFHSGDQAYFPMKDLLALLLAHCLISVVSSITLECRAMMSDRWP